jgi:hypothetical protein
MSSQALTSVLTIAGFVVLLIWLLRILTRRRHTTQHTITSILQSTSTQGYRQSLAKIRDELTRARRYERALSVVVFRPNGFELSEDSTGMALRPVEKATNCKKRNNDSRKIEFLVRGCSIRDFVRRSDIITYDEVNNQIAIVLPETDKTRAASAVERLKCGLGKKFSDGLCIGISEFPVDGFDIEQLVTQAADSADDANMLDQPDDEEKRDVSDC